MSAVPPRPVTAEDIERIDWAKGTGLIPVIVQHARRGTVLMLGFMNREALAATFKRGRVVFFSRSRQQLWEKGETSGHYLELVDARLDCDADALLVTAIPHGPVCHTGAAGCFGDESPGLTAAERLSFLAELEHVITERVAGHHPESYSARLIGGGVRRVAQKVGEEGVEVALAAVAEPDDALLGECADLLYHLLLLLRARGLSLDAVMDELARRHAAQAGAG